MTQFTNAYMRHQGEMSFKEQSAAGFKIEVSYIPDGM